MRKVLKNQFGIGLVETIVALGVSVVIIVALVSLSLFVLRASLQSKLLLQSSELANEQVQLLKAYRDSEGWTDFISALPGCTSSTRCYISIPGGTFTVASGDRVLNPNTPGQLNIGFFATDLDSGGNVLLTTQQVRISVVASWYLGSDIQSTYLYTDLTNWQGN